MKARTAACTEGNTGSRQVQGGPRQAQRDTEGNEGELRATERRVFACTKAAATSTHETSTKKAKISRINPSGKHSTETTEKNNIINPAKKQQKKQ